MDISEDVIRILVCFLFFTKSIQCLRNILKSSSPRMQASMQQVWCSYWTSESNLVNTVFWDHIDVILIADNSTLTISNINGFAENYNKKTALIFIPCFTYSNFKLLHKLNINLVISHDSFNYYDFKKHFWGVFLRFLLEIKRVLLKQTEITHCSPDSMSRTHKDNVLNADSRETIKSNYSNHQSN